MINLIGQRHMNPRMKEKLKAEKIAFFTTELDLNEEEAIRFWPVFNDYEKQKNTIRDNIKSLSSANENEAEQAINKFVSLKEEEHQLDMSYLKKLKTILPAEKILVLIELEEKFRHHILKRVRKKMKRRGL